MSADNRICIMQTRWGQWAVWHGSASAEYYEPPAMAPVFETEGEAEDHARKREEELGYVEYGIQHIGIGEQDSALIDTIADLDERLLRLRATGSQFEPSHDEGTDQ